MQTLHERLTAAGLTPTEIRPTSEGLAAVSGLATLTDHRVVFAKTFAEEPLGDVFPQEAEGLAVLRAAGLATADVLHCGENLLVLSLLQPRPDRARFWEQLAQNLSHLHGTTVSDRFGWAQDNWLGPMRQLNPWNDNGFDFFAECRVLRWLPEPRVTAKLDARQRDALTRLCAALPELMPPRPACLTHGDFWTQNILATADGTPAVIDPAVSYMWADVDLAHLWSTPHPPAAERFFAVYGELTGEEPGWTERLAYVQLRQHLALMAMFEDDWGSTEAVHQLIAPFLRTGPR